MDQETVIPLFFNEIPLSQFTLRRCAPPIALPKVLQNPYTLADKQAKLDFLTDHVERMHYHDPRIDHLFEEILYKKLSALKNEESLSPKLIEEAFAEILVTRSGIINLGLIPVLYNWIVTHKSPSCDHIPERLLHLVKNSRLRKEIETGWEIPPQAIWAESAPKEKKEIAFKRNIVSMLLSHPRQEQKQNCFAFAIAWAIFLISPERIVADLRHIVKEGGLTKKNGNEIQFFPFLRYGEKLHKWHTHENHPLFEIWSSVLASMAEGNHDGAITSAIAHSILHQVVKFLHTENERRQIPQIKQSILERIYVGYDPNAFAEKGGFILHDRENGFSRIDTLDKFSQFLVQLTKKWIGDRMNKQEVVRDLLITFHEDHKDLRTSLSTAVHSKYTPWACNPGNDPRKIIMNYFELAGEPSTSEIIPKDLGALYAKVDHCQGIWHKKLHAIHKEGIIPMRIRGKHTFNLIIPQTAPYYSDLKKKGILIFADTNWSHEGEDLFLAFLLDKNAPLHLVEVTSKGEITKILDSAEWLSNTWEFFLPSDYCDNLRKAK